MVVKVAPNNGVWTISDQPDFSYKVSTFKKVNNQEVEEVEDKITDRLVNNISQGVIYVTADKQTFQVNRQNLINYEFDDIIKDDYPNQKLKFDIQFQLQANQVNPYKVERFNYNYTLIVPGPQTTTTQGALQEPGSLVLVSDTSSGGLPNFSGEEYYNIKKPAGGYLTFKFTCPGLKTKNDPVVRVAGTSTKKTISVEESPNTKYTNLITVDGIGALVLSVSYTSSLYEVNGRALAASAQINFTL